MESTDYLEGLNDEQRRAVNLPLEDNILIVAGAGSGKTTTLARRVLHLLRKGVQPGRIICCTFTNKATSEMRERIGRLAGDQLASRVRVGTLHSIASRIVGTHHGALGIEKRPLPLDEDASVKLIVRAWQTRQGSRSGSIATDIDKLASSLEAGMPVARIIGQFSSESRAALVRARSDASRLSAEDLLSLLEASLREARAQERTYAVTALAVIERLQLQGLWPPEKVDAMGEAGLDAVAHSMISEKEKSLFLDGNDGSGMPQGHGSQAGATQNASPNASTLSSFMDLYRLYMETKRQKSVMDFGDMVVMATRILRENPVILDTYRQHYDYLMVDECQDLNSEQYAFIRVLSGDGRSIRVLMVGDQDQSIYAFRGANCLLMGQPFLETFKATLVMLTRNYRSGRHIVNASNEAITLNCKRIPKELVPNSSKDGVVHFKAADNEAEMAAWVRKQVVRMVESGIKPSEIAMVSRRNDDLQPIARELTIAGIPNRTIGSAHMFESPAVKEALNWAILCLRNERDDLVPGCLSAPSVGLGEVSVARLESEALVGGRTMLGMLLDPPRTLRKAELAAVARFKGLMEAFHSGRVDVLVNAIVNGSFGGAQSMRDWNESLKSRGARSVRFLDDLVLVAREVQSRIDTDGSDEDDEGNPLHPVEEMMLFVRLQAGEIGVDAGGLIIGDEQEEVEAVQLMTIHKAKGLEFDAVFYLNADDTERLEDTTLRYYGEFAEPGGLSDVQVGDIEESRRIAYVAMTRPREILVFTLSRSRMINGNWLNPGWSEAAMVAHRTMRSHARTTTPANALAVPG